MRFKYSTTHPEQDIFDSLPRIPLLLKSNKYSIEAAGLVDSGATVNVLPFSLGKQLGFRWDDQKATIRLAGNMLKSFAIPVLVQAKLANYPEITLAFAWIPNDEATLILGQTNFFSLFEVCFFRQDWEFEITPRQKA